MNYTPETPFQIAPTTGSSALVYNLKQDGSRKGKPAMVNDVEIRIHGSDLSDEALAELSELIADHLNNSYPVIKGNEITIELGKHDGSGDKKVCYTWAEANKTLAEWSAEAPIKISCRISFLDSGLTYNHPLNIIQGGKEENGKSFYQNFIERILTVSGRKKPYAMPNEQFQLMQSNPAIQEVAENARNIVDQHFAHLV